MVQYNKESKVFELKNSDLRQLLADKYNRVLESLRNMESGIRRREGQNNKYYPHIPNRYFYEIAVDMIREGLSEETKYIDAGCGLGNTIMLLKEIIGEEDNLYGLEYDELYSMMLSLDLLKYRNLIKGDMLNFDFKGYKFIYSYNPIIVTELMEEAIKNIVKTMDEGAIFYFEQASNVTALLKELGFTNLFSVTWKYVKQNK